MSLRRARQRLSPTRMEVYSAIFKIKRFLANSSSDRQIPSIISYVDGEEYVGNQAKAQLVRNKDNTVAYFRDFIGQEFKNIDPTHCHASAHPKEVDNAVALTIQDKEEGEPSTVTIEDAAARLIKRLALSASDFIGSTVDSAVITVPTNFSDKQCASLKESAKKAGIEVLQLITEPLAALLAYDGRPDAEVTDKTVVVADFGGTRSDIAIVASRGGIYTILATSHDYDFAGCHLDQVLMDYFAKEFIKWNTTDPRVEARPYAKLKAEAEACKKALSIGTNSAFAIESLAEGADFSSTINRLRFETVGRKVFDGFNRMVEQTVKKAGLDVLDIDQVILTGGTSHIPKIANNMRMIFPDTTEVLAPSTSATAINPSELAARGAALQASLIELFDAEDLSQISHPAVTTLKHISNSIGVLAITDDETRGVFTPIVKADTGAPVRRVVKIAAPKAGGDCLVKIIEGASHIKVTKPEPKPKSNGAKVADADSDDSEEESDEEDEEIRERVHKVGKVLAELAVKGVSAGAEVEISVEVKADLSVVIVAREAGKSQAVRAEIAKPN